jgi:uncharacterized protein
MNMKRAFSPKKFQIIALILMGVVITSTGTMLIPSESDIEVIIPNQTVNIPTNVPEASLWDPHPLLYVYSPTRENIAYGDGALATWVVYETGDFDYNDKGPTLLIRSPYDSFVTTILAGLADSRRSQNYARQPEFLYNDEDCFVVAQDFKGSGQSTGTFTVFGDEAGSGKATIDWLKNPANGWWWNGKVGSWGGSALGINQYAYAGENSPELVAQYISAASPEQYDHVLMQGGQLRYNLISTWSSGFTGGLNYVNNTVTQHPLKDSYWDQRSLTDLDMQGKANLSSSHNRAQYVNAAGVHIGGWDDVFMEGSISGYLEYNYMASTAARNHQVLYLAPMGHGYQIGELLWDNWDDPPSGGDVGDLEDWLFQTEFYYTRGSGDYNSRYTAQNKVYYYMCSDPAATSDPNANEWRTAGAWPIASTDQQWYFAPGYDQWNGILSLNPTTVPSSQSYIYNPATPTPTNGGKNLGTTSFDDGSPIGQGVTDQRGVNGANPGGNLPDVTHRSDVVSFVSPALENAYEFTGKINAKLYVQSNCADTDFVVKLVDVFPDGREMLLNDGIVRAARMNGYDTTTWMTSGNTYELDVDLWSRAWRFQPGHKIKVMVQSSNYPKNQRNPNKAENFIPLKFADWSSYNIAENKIQMSTTYPSSISLPVTAGLLTPPPQDPNIWITSVPPAPNNGTSYTVKWDSADVDNVDILLNDIVKTTGQPASNPSTGYVVTGLTPNINNNITVIGKRSGLDDAQDSIFIRPYCSAPAITLTVPTQSQTFSVDDINMAWSMDSTNSGGVSKLWIESDILARTEISPGLSGYSIMNYPDGSHWVNLTAKGLNGMYSSVNHSFEVWASNPLINVTSTIPGPNNSTSYTLKWESDDLDSVDIKLNNILIATTQPASNPTIGYVVDNLKKNENNTIQIVGKRNGFGDVFDSLIIHPYCDSPALTITSPLMGQYFSRYNVDVNFTAKALNSSGIGEIWIQSNKLNKTQLNPTDTSYVLTKYVNGSNWVQISVKGNNGMSVAKNVSFNYIILNSSGSTSTSTTSTSSSSSTNTADSSWFSSTTGIVSIGAAIGILIGVSAFLIRKFKLRETLNKVQWQE